MADIKREDVMKYLENANMLEISELISEIEDNVFAERKSKKKKIQE